MKPLSPPEKCERDFSPIGNLEVFCIKVGLALVIRGEDFDGGLPVCV